MPLGTALLAVEVQQLRREVAQLRAASCSCLYCSTGDGLNCIHKRGVKHLGLDNQDQAGLTAAGSTPATPIRSVRPLVDWVDAPAPRR